MNKVIRTLLLLLAASAIMAQQSISTDELRIVESNWWSEVETTFVQTNEQNKELEIHEYSLVQKELEDVNKKMVFEEKERVKIEGVKKPFYIIGYAAVNTKSAAIKILEQLKDRGYSADYFWIPDYEPEGKELYRVYVGPYKTRDETQSELLRIKEIKPSAYIKLIK